MDMRLSLSVEACLYLVIIITIMKKVALSTDGGLLRHA